MFGWLGAILHVTGWAILPARGGRRVLAAALSVLTFVTMLAGTSLVWLSFIPFALWLLVRQRPGITYFLTLVPAGVALLALAIFGPFAEKQFLFAIVLASAVAAAWAARAIAIRERRSGKPGSRPIDS